MALCSAPLLVVAQEQAKDDGSLAASTAIIGKVVEVQGAVAVKGAGAQRWTPLAADRAVALVAGDWLRSDPIGANAARLRLGVAGESATVVVLGPGTLLEVVGTGGAKLIRGEIAITPADGAEFKLGEVAVLERSVFRRAEADLAPVKVGEASPALRGFEGAAVTETMGSLVAAVDGRDAPLAIGYHHVRVDVRDQIARTVIEQSFVNHSDEVLEGTFYFPLPPDASVSGFGMWIGDELVEADIVEKQRAREIYEIILHEKRDPGLLEWAGGSLFKARVYPIPAGGEKRIKITYTQVLPARGGTFHYDYALQSDLLKNNPLRELSIKVRVHSALPLRDVRCPSHATSARVQRSANAADVEFEAQNVSPSRDFRVEVAFEAREKPVTFIPHQRGDDGYFLALINPPADGGWKRELVCDGDPLEIIFLVDTSASVGASARANQRTFIDALAGSLAPGDRFNVIAFDNQAAKLWANAKPVNAETRTAAAKFLEERASLGWSDIGRGLAMAMGQVRAGADANAHIIYLGDGVPVRGVDSDPGAFANRLARNHANAKAHVHAVATSAAHEPLVLATMARLGAGGSVREALDRDAGRKAAGELLVEISQPSLLNLVVEFRGLSAARVYPEELPNLSAGAQQIVVGRYLPGGDGNGELVVTGERDGEPVRFSAPIELRGASKGNSFIPRLWARRHLDVLLGQGATQEVRSEIIQLSERFKIMTPYTSLLVLESDADRERFKVPRRFQMRDGERYFAEGRDQASVELKRKHLKLAGTWRLELREQILTELGKQGRDVKLDASGELSQTGLFGLKEQRAPVSFASKIGTFGKHAEEQSQSSAKNAIAFSVVEEDASDPFGGPFSPRDDPFGGRGGSNLFPSNSSGGGDPFGGADAFGAVDADSFSGALEGVDVETPEELLAQGDASPPSVAHDRESGSVPLRSRSTGRSAVPTSTTSSLSDPFGTDGGARYSYGYNPPEIPQTFGGGGGGFGSGGFPVTPANPTSFGLATSGDLSAYASSGVTALPVVSDPPTVTARVEEYEPPEGAPADLVQLELALLSRASKLAEAGVRLEFITRERDLAQAVNPLDERRDLVSKDAWLTRERSDWGPTSVESCDAKERAIVSRTFGLGTRRATDPTDLDFPLPRHWMGIYKDEFDSVRIEQRDGNLLTFVIDDGEDEEFERFVVDTERQVIVKQEEWDEGEIYWSTEYFDFVEVAGFWWPGRIVDREIQSGQMDDTLIETRALTGAEFDTAWEAETAGLDGALVIDLPLPDLDTAQNRVLRGGAGVGDYLTVASQHVTDDRWDEARESFEKVRARVGDKVGSRWLDLMFRKVAGDHQSVKELVEAAARELVNAEQRPDELAIVRFFMSAIQTGAGDGRSLHDLLKPVYARQPKRADALKEWRLLECELEPSPERGLRLIEELAGEFPDEIHIQLRLATLLGGQRRRPEAIELLRKLLGDAELVRDIAEQIRDLLEEMLADEFRYDEQRELLAEWIKAEPDSWADVQENYLEVLVLDNDVAEADRLVRSWLIAPDPSESELEAAAAYVTRQMFDSYDDQIAPEWLPVVEAMIKARADSAEGLIDAFDEFRHYIDSTAVGDRLAEHFRGLLEAAGVETDTRLLVVYAMIASTTRDGDRAAPREKAVALIEKQIATDGKSRDRVKRIEQAKELIFESEKQLAFFDRVLPLLAPEDAHRFLHEIFGCLVGGGFSAARVERALSLINQIDNGSENYSKMIERHTAINKWFFKGVLSESYKREASAIRKLPPRGQQAAKAKLKAQARSRLIEHLMVQGARDEKVMPVPVRAWVNLEISHQQLQLSDADPQAVAERCFAVLETRDGFGELEPSLTERAVRTISHVVAETGQEPIAAQLRRWLENQITAEAANDRWKWHLVRLLIASDQPTELEKQLRAWIRPDRVDRNWHTLLAYLMAEQNRVPEAIAEAEALRKSEAGIEGDALMVLADWYLLVGDLENYEQALVDGLDSSPSVVLNRLLGADGGFTGDAATPAVLAALVRKSVTENRALGWMIGLYERTKDPRLLAGLPAALRGHAAEEIYRFIGNDVAGVTKLIYDEASTDAIVDALREARVVAGDNPTDLRALDLLELAVARLAAELADQPDLWIGRARAALRRACAKDWVEGERAMMAQFLVELGTIDAEPLAIEQREQLRALYEDGETDAVERLRIAVSLAQLLSEYSMHQQAADLLEPHVVAEAPQDAELERLTAAYRLVAALEALGHFARAEMVINREAERGRSDDWRLRRHESWLGALEEGATVSAGSGRDLYVALRDELQHDIFERSFEAREELANLMFETFAVAREKEIKSVKRDTLAFIQKMFSDAKPRDVESYGEQMADLADGLPELIGKRETLTFLLDRADHEPAWMRLTGDGIWEYAEYEMAELRKGLVLGGEAADRMLALASHEMAEELAQGEVPDAEVFDCDSELFWRSKRNHFADVAEKVALEHLDNPDVVAAAGEFLLDYLDMKQRGVALALAAIEAGTFEDADDAEIEIDFAEELIELDEVAQAVKVIEGYLESHPDSTRALLVLMGAKFATGESDDLPGLLARAIATLGGKPDATAQSMVAETCLDCELFAVAVKGFEAALALQRTASGKVLRNDSYAGEYYQGLAKARAGLGETRAAVEAISGALVSGQQHRDIRRRFMGTLMEILDGAQDLEEFALAFDQSAARSSTENPILRRAIASAFMSREKFGPAIRHLQFAIEYRPDDAGLRTNLVAALDGAGQAELAAVAQLELAARDRKQPQRYRDLADRYEQLGRADEAERARASIVEVQPSEAANHRLLAEVRQDQARWDEAIVHWRNAAELHTTDPVSLIALTKAYLRQQQWRAARESLERLEATEWPERFKRGVEEALKELGDRSIPAPR